MSNEWETREMRKTSMSQYLFSDFIFFKWQIKEMNVERTQIERKERLDNRTEWNHIYFILKCPFSAFCFIFLYRF